MKTSCPFECVISIQFIKINVDGFILIIYFPSLSLDTYHCCNQITKLKTFFFFVFNKINGFDYFLLWFKKKMFSSIVPFSHHFFLLTFKLLHIQYGNSINVDVHVSCDLWLRSFSVLYFLYLLENWWKQTTGVIQCSALFYSHHESHTNTLKYKGDF